MLQESRLLARLRGLNEEIAQQHPTFHQESRRAPATESERRHVADVPAEIATESIVLKRLRPVLAIKNDTTELTFADLSDSDVWKDKLARAKDKLDAAIRSVGRIELQGGRLDWVGTGWLVAEDVLVTNRHVANEFSREDGQRFVFRMGPSAPMTARADFLQEIDNPATLEFRLVKPLHIEDESGPDIAFFEIETSSGGAKLAHPVDLAASVVETAGVAVIGYPAFDSRIPDVAFMEQLYGRVYDKKRLAPGAVTRIEGTRLLHNCTTLGGNSGSIIIDLDSGRAVGLHFSGSFLTTNYAVRSDVVADLLDRVRSGQARRRRSDEVATRTSAPTPTPQPSPKTRGTASVTIPLTITVSLGDAEPQLASLGGGSPPSFAVAGSEGDDLGTIVEGRVEDYAGRRGYVADFLEGASVPLPSIVRNRSDVLDFDIAGTTDHVLRYEHYSVVMSRSRRMCIFSAVNIDGRLSKKSARAAWKWDPRIPKAQQIMHECYGSPPKFSRGHMTRREDPGWGLTLETAKRGNEDSMHVTNTTPQMQAFNAPIWLALEDYALQHARDDKMKICVFTGPFFGADDPQMYGVTIPLAFWKIIAFIHDQTQGLCATGYTMDQTQSLQPEEEFVFGAFQSAQLNVATQVSIRSIETRSGLSFGTLATVDPLAAGSEGREAGRPNAPLQELGQIRFVA